MSKVMAVFGNDNDYPNFQVLSTHSFPLHRDNRPFYAHFTLVKSEAQRGYYFLQGHMYGGGGGDTKGIHSFKT